MFQLMLLLFLIARTICGELQLHLEILPCFLPKTCLFSPPLNVFRIVSLFIGVLGESFRESFVFPNFFTQGWSPGPGHQLVCFVAFSRALRFSQTCFHELQNFLPCAAQNFQSVLVLASVPLIPLDVLCSVCSSSDAQVHCRTVSSDCCSGPPSPVSSISVPNRRWSLIFSFKSFLERAAYYSIELLRADVFPSPPILSRPAKMIGFFYRLPVFCAFRTSLH